MLCFKSRNDGVMLLAEAQLHASLFPSAMANAAELVATKDLCHAYNGPVQRLVIDDQRGSKTDDRFMSFFAKDALIFESLTEPTCSPCPRLEFDANQQPLSSHLFDHGTAQLLESLQCIRPHDSRIFDEFLINQHIESFNSNRRSQRIPTKC